MLRWPVALALALVSADANASTHTSTLAATATATTGTRTLAAATATTARPVPDLWPRLEPPPLPPLSSPPDEDPLLPRPLEHARYIAYIHGGWSAAMTAAWVLSAGAYEAPVAEGLLGVAVSRVLYGTTYSLLVSAEIALLRLALGPDFEGLSHGRLRNDWLVGYQLPGRCRGQGRACGLGLGGYSELSVRPVRGPVPIELVLTSGWLQGHHDADETRTLMESVWATAPLIVRGHLPLRLGPLQVEPVLGAGLYYGLHNAHVHARPGVELDTPPFELVILDGGVGLGVHAKLWITLFDLLRLEAEADVAPLPLGGRNRDAPAVVSVLRTGAEGGLVVWRRASVGIGLARRVFDPVRVSLHWWTAALSSEPLTRLGHRAFVFQFEVPIVLGEEDEE